MKQCEYFGEIVEILFERKGKLRIRYEDSVEEFVDLDTVSNIRKVKSPKRSKTHKKTKNINKTERKEARFRKHFGSKERVLAINAEPCVICGRSPSQNMHTVSRGAGGTWKDIVPGCPKCHAEQHKIGIQSFQEKYQIDLVETAKFYAEKYPRND